MPIGVYDRGDPIARFWGKVDKNGPTMPHMSTPCWVWTRALHYGYGVTHWGDRNRQSHVVAYMLTNGPVPDGLFVLHECDNRACCNPSHLHAGTQKMNMQEASERNRIPKGDRHPARARPEYLARGDRNASSRGAGNPNAKLSESDVREIRAAFAAGESAASLAARFNVWSTSINNILSRRTWARLDALPA